MKVFQKLTSSNSILLLLINKLVNITKPITRGFLQTVHAIVDITELLRALCELSLHVGKVALVLLVGQSSRAR